MHFPIIRQQSRAKPMHVNGGWRHRLLCLEAVSDTRKHLNAACQSLKTQNQLPIRYLGHGAHTHGTPYTQDEKRHALAHAREPASHHALSRYPFINVEKSSTHRPDKKKRLRCPCTGARETNDVLLLSMK